MDSGWKLPPKAKVYEALSAVADERVRLFDAYKAEVTSSSGDKKYTVEWSEDGKAFSSNDNASYWQGYIGYPIIAVLLTTGRVPHNAAALTHLRGVEWKKLNKQHKNDYDKAVAAVLTSLTDRGFDIGPIARDVDEIYMSLQELDLHKLPQRRRPPV